MSARKDKNALVVGGDPRVNLLPPEVAADKRAKAMRRSLVAVLVVIALVAGAGYGLASYAASVAQQNLEAENARTAQILAEQAEYIEVRTTAERVSTAVAALKVGASTELDLAEYINEIESRMPEGASLINITIEAASPLDGYAQASVPLQPERIATFNMTVRMASLDEIRDWLKDLETLDGFADATPGAVTMQEEGASFESTVTLHVNSLAFSERFANLTPEGESE